MSLSTSLSGGKRRDSRWVVKMYWADMANQDRRVQRAVSYAVCACWPRILALFAVILMMVAIAGMVTGRPGDRVGWLVRALALLCFVAAVVLNVAAH